VTEIHTPESALRIRVIRLPNQGELEELQLDHFRVGQVYVIPARLASILILSGIAELIESHAVPSEAADYGHPRLPRQK
jgi:hypothetical protein